MKVTGYEIREAIRRWEIRRDTAASQFDDSLWRFKDEDRPSSDDAMRAFAEAEAAIARLQAAQVRYNLSIELAALNESMSLAEAVKRLGGVARAEKMWRAALTRDTVSPRKRYFSLDAGERTRRADEERAVRSLGTMEVMDRAARAAAFTGALRAGIAEANGRRLEIEGVEPALLE
jgi:hypothetical protein